MVFVTRDDQISFSKNIQVLYFFNCNMPFHSKLLLSLSKLEQQYRDYIYLAIDTDNFPSQCVRFSVHSVPSLLFLKNGKQIRQVVGSVKKQNIIDVFADIIVNNGEKND